MLGSSTGSSTDSTGEGKEEKNISCHRGSAAFNTILALTEYAWQLLQSASQKSVTCVKLLATGLRQLTLQESIF